MRQTKKVWILSDMMNEAPERPMPKLLEMGPERMFERAKANGLVVPLPRYEIRIYGASTPDVLRVHGWPFERLT